MLTQPEVYHLFNRLDRLPAIMEPRLGRWRAWPVAKMQLLWHLMQSGSPDANANGVRWTEKVGQRIRCYPSGFGQAIDLIRKVRRRSRSKGAVGMMYVPRACRTAENRDQDFIFGTLLNGKGLNSPALPLEYHSQLISAGTIEMQQGMSLVPLMSVSEQWGLMLMALPRLRRVAALLNDRLGDAGIPLSRDLIFRKILLALALFEARRRTFRWFASRLDLDALVLTYAPGRLAETAAARELGIPVIELQHGVIGPHCPDYGWPQDYATFRSEMPLPDRIAVFGPAFRDFVMRSGFWTEDQVVCTGAAAIDQFRSLSVPLERIEGPQRLVFMTQSTSRRAALAFWRAFADAAQAATQDVRVAIKIHPEEEPDVYRSLAAEYPSRFEILPPDSNPAEKMIEADIVVSYNSMALIEAMALGRPAVSLCGGAIPEGFAGSFDLHAIRDVMPHVASPDQLLTILRDRAGDTAKLRSWSAQARARSEDFFSNGFSASAPALINEMLVFPDPA